MPRFNKLTRLSAVLPLLILPSFTKGETHASNPGDSMQQFSSFAVALVAIGDKFHVRTGFELARNDISGASLSLDLSVADVTEALNRLTEQRPAYIWKFEDGVYDVFPKSRNDRISDLKIRRYYVKDATVEVASIAINNLPEFKAWLDQNRMLRRELDNGIPSSKIRISLEAGNVSLRSLLNRLVFKFNAPRWQIVKYGEHMEYLGIYF